MVTLWLFISRVFFVFFLSLSPSQFITNICHSDLLIIATSAMSLQRNREHFVLIQKTPTEMRWGASVSPEHQVSIRLRKFSPASLGSLNEKSIKMYTMLWILGIFASLQRWDGFWDLRLFGKQGFSTHHEDVNETRHLTSGRGLFLPLFVRETELEKKILSWSYFTS